jgi:osmotically-inducible protein OsmY
MLKRECFPVAGIRFVPLRWVPGLGCHLTLGLDMDNQSTGRVIRSVAALQALLCIYGCSTTSTEANADRQGDPQLAARVKDALTRDQRVYAAHINVTADHGGVVHLTGMVASADDLNQAKRDAQSVAGVRAVVDDLQLQERGGVR